mmetsp:Transcript_43773/g.102158  ORF Transcript_43773/g.102158 Transcript_43773/m.102158 type:complete len:177 (-) Transcript_43773:81-611(-)
MQAPPAWFMAVVAKLPAAQQQQIQELLMRVMKDMFLPALATVPAAWALAYVPHFIKTGVVISKTGIADYDNRQPRATDPAQFDGAKRFIQRCAACHLNALESFPAFAAAVVLCKLQKVKPLEAAKLCFRYLIGRVLYTILYLAGINDTVAGMRSLVWMDSIYCIWRLYSAALTVSK